MGRAIEELAHFIAGTTWPLVTDFLQRRA